jgi:hypothetical protein
MHSQMRQCHITVAAMGCFIFVRLLRLVKLPKSRVQTQSIINWLVLYPIHMHDWYGLPVESRHLHIQMLAHPFQCKIHWNWVALDRAHHVLLLHCMLLHNTCLRLLMSYCCTALGFTVEYVLLQWWPLGKDGLLVRIRNRTPLHARASPTSTMQPSACTTRSSLHRIVVVNCFLVEPLSPLTASSCQGASSWVAYHCGSAGVVAFVCITSRYC